MHNLETSESGLMPLVSIVIPVYNTVRYLGDCIESVKNQSYPKLEILLIDDGSEYHCADLCDYFAQQDERINVIHKRNGGVSDARNLGTTLASGEYITYVDSDDIISSTMIIDLLGALLKSDSDVSICNIKRFRNCPPNSPKRPYCGAVEQCFSGVSAMEAMLYQKHFDTSASGKLYKTDLMKQHYFPVGKLFEDLATIYRVLYDAKRVVYLYSDGYYYRQNPQSIMHQAFHTGIFDEIEAADQIIDFVSAHCPASLPAARSRKYSAYAQVFRWINRSDNSQSFSNQQEIIWDYLWQYRFKMLLDKHARWKNRCAAVCVSMGRSFFSHF